MVDDVLNYLEGKPENTFGELIRRHRKNIGFTQEQLAERVGVSQNYIAKIETGYAKSLSPKTLTKLAIALDIPNETLVEMNMAFYEGVAKLYEKREDLDEAFHSLPTKTKELLLKIAPIIQKYMF